MTCHHIELSDRAFSLLHTYARNRGVDLDEAVERALGPFTLATKVNGVKRNGANGNGHNGAATATADATEVGKPMLTFRLSGEVGRCYERLREEIELGTCDELVRQMEQDFVRLLLRTYPLPQS